MGMENPCTNTSIQKRHCLLFTSAPFGHRTIAPNPSTNQPVPMTNQRCKPTVPSQNNAPNRPRTAQKGRLQRPGPESVSPSAWRPARRWADSRSHVPWGGWDGLPVSGECGSFLILVVSRSPKRGTGLFLRHRCSSYRLLKQIETYRAAL